MHAQQKERTMEEGEELAEENFFCL